MDVFLFSVGVSFVDDIVDRVLFFREYWCGILFVVFFVIVYEECKLFLIINLLVIKDILIWWKYNI